MVRRCKIVLGFQPGPGHVSRTSAVCAILRQRGHSITLATATSYRPRLVDVAHDDFLPVGPDWTEDHVAVASTSGEPGDALRDRSHAIVEKFFHGAAQVTDDLLGAFQNSARPDCFVFDYTLFGGPPAAELL